MLQTQTLPGSEAAGLGATRIDPIGGRSFATAARLERTLREIQVDASRVELDLRKLTFMDCSGMRVIVRAAQRARRSGHRLTVVPDPAQAQRASKLTGAADVIDHGWRPQHG